MGPVPFGKAQDKPFGKLRRLNAEELRASPDTYRVVVYIDDVPYQAGEDWLSLKGAIKAATKQQHPARVLDDRGTPRFSQGGTR